MIKYHISDYLYMKENVEKIVDNILSSTTHYEAFLLYKVLLNSMVFNKDIEIVESERYLDINFLRTKFIELFDYANELCKSNGLEF